MTFFRFPVPALGNLTMTCSTSLSKSIGFPKPFLEFLGIFNENIFTKNAYFRKRYSTSTKQVLTNNSTEYELIPSIFRVGRPIQLIRPQNTVLGTLTKDQQLIADGGLYAKLYGHLQQH